VASLQNCKKKYLIACYPTPIDDHRVPRQLIHYGILKEDEILSYPREKWLEVLRREERNKRVDIFNETCRLACVDQDVEFISFKENLMDESGVLVRREYVDISPYNLHVLWEPLLKLFCDKFDGKGMGIDFKYLSVDLDSSAGAYISDKHSKVGGYEEASIASLEPLIEFIKENTQPSSYWLN
jgi:hypothetical protein